MEDMAAKLSAILKDPESLNQLQHVAQSLGLQNNAPAPAQQPQNAPNAPGPDVLQALQSAMGPAAAKAPNQKPADQKSNGPSLNAADALKGMLPGMDISTLIKVQRALSSVDNNDKNVQLLRALKPHLAKQREGRIEEAMRIMQLIHILPLLKESGLFGGEKR